MNWSYDKDRGLRTAKTETSNFDIRRLPGTVAYYELTMYRDDKTICVDMLRHLPIIKLAAKLLERREFLREDFLDAENKAPSDAAQIFGQIREIERILCVECGVDPPEWYAFDSKLVIPNSTRIPENGPLRGP